MDSSKGLRIVFVRHPETEWGNVKDPESSTKGQRLLGWTDVALSSIGVERASNLSLRFREEGITRIETSPLKRAVLTAQMIAADISVPLVFQEDLREINFGSCEGLTFEELESKFPAVHKAYLAQGSDVVFPEGESFEGFRSRVKRWLNSLLASHDGETVLVISHGGVIRVALCLLLDWSPETFWSLRQDYGGITSIGVYGDRRIIERINGR